MHPSYTQHRRRTRLLWMVGLVAVFAVVEVAVAVEVWGLLRKPGLVECGAPDRARNAGW